MVEMKLGTIEDTPPSPVFMIVFVASLIFGLLVTGSVNAPVNRPIPAYQ